MVRAEGRTALQESQVEVFGLMVQREMVQHKCSRQQAVQAAARKDPAAYQAFVAATQKRAR